MPTLSLHRRHEWTRKVVTVGAVLAGLVLGLEELVALQRSRLQQRRHRLR